MKLLDKDYCPLVPADIKCNRLFDDENSSYYMGSESLDKYIKLSSASVDPVKRAVGYMDGTRTIDEIQTILLNEIKIDMNIADLCELLAKAGLILNQPDDIKVSKQEMDYLSIKIKSWSLDKIFDQLSAFGNKYWSICKWVTGTIILLGILIVIKDWRALLNISNYQVNGHISIGIVLLMVVFILSVGIHEMAHAVVGCRYGLHPKELVFALYVGMPMFYVRTPGILSLPPQKRIYIWSAGIYMNLVLASLSLILLQFTGGISYQILLIIGSTNLSLALGNISPLLPLDGYFILTTILKKPNLRRESFRQFKNWFFRKKNKFSGMYVLYFAVASSFYTFIVLVELRWVVKTVINGINMNYTVYDYLDAFKYVILILGIIVGKKLIECCCNCLKNRLVNA